MEVKIRPPRSATAVGEDKYAALFVCGMMTEWCLLLGARSCLCVRWHFHRHGHQRRFGCCCCCSCEWCEQWIWNRLCQEVQPSVIGRTAYHRDTGHSARIFGLVRSVAAVWLPVKTLFYTLLFLPKNVEGRKI